MPKKQTTVIAVRAPDELVEAIREEAEGRKVSVNELLNLELAARFKRGSVVRKSHQETQNPDEAPFIPEDDE